MTQEHYAKLSQYEDILRDIVNGTFHYSGKIQRIFMEVYTEMTGTTIPPSEWSCNACMSQKARIVAFYYFNGLSAFTQTATEETTASTEITPADVAENKKERNAIRKKAKFGI